MLIKQFKQDGLTVKIYDTRGEMGKAAAAEAAAAIRELLSGREEINIIFPAAPSQNEMLAGLAASDVDFSRVNAFHMDEYIGLPEDSPQRFSSYLDKHIFGLAPFKSVHYLGRNREGDTDAECRRYAKLLEEHPADLSLIGIGENGHIAFNDPHTADFEDPLAVKVVTLDEVCRMQQVRDGAFAAAGDVPETAYTLTIPALLGARRVICTVPAAAKAQAVRNAVCGEISPACPASVMRKYAHCTLFCDRDSGRWLLDA